MTSKSIVNFFSIILLFLFMLLYAQVHYRASFSFPIPWTEDEAVFLWPAISFQETNSLYAPELHPDRPIFLMPPAYMIVSGILFKVFGFSLAFARTLSLIFMVAAFILLVCMTRKYGFYLPSLLLCGFFLLSKQFVVTGNVARMEALLLLVVVAGFFLLQMERDYKALALLSVSPLLHPNGVYFFAAAVIYFFLCGRFRARGWTLNNSDKIFIGLSLLMWLAYTLYVGYHWQYFLSDMSLQFGRKVNKLTLDNLLNQLSEKNVMLSLLTLFCLGYSLKENVEAIFLLALGAPAWVINRIGNEMWYDVFDSLFYLLLSIVLLHVARHLSARITIWKSKAIQHGILAIFTLCVLLWNYRMGTIEGPIDYPADMTWAGMHMTEEGVPYLNNSDVTKVRAFLNSLESADHVASVEMYPFSDGLLPWDVDRKRIRFSVPSVYFAASRWNNPSGGRPEPAATPDVYIIHASRYFPQWLIPERQRQLGRVGIDSLDKADILHQRDGTEIWYVAHPAGASKP
jgi:hypothetical protein